MSILCLVLVHHTWALSWSMRRFRDCSMDRSISDFLPCRVSNRRSKCSVARRSANWPFSCREKMNLCSASVAFERFFYLGAASKQEPAKRSNADMQERRENSLHSVVWREAHLICTQTVTDCFTASRAGFVQLIKIYTSSQKCRN